jgi:hypothetical protein
VIFTVNAYLFIKADSPLEAARFARQRNDYASDAHEVAKRHHLDISEVTTDGIAVICLMVVRPGCNALDFVGFGEDL